MTTSADSPAHPPPPGGLSTKGEVESPWPTGAGEVAFLLDAASTFERHLLEDWVRRTRPSTAREPHFVPLPSSRRGLQPPSSDRRLEELFAIGDQLTLAPLRVAWLPVERDGKRRARPADILLGDPRDPGTLRARWIHRRDPNRMRLVAAEPATIAELHGRWRARGLAEVTGLASFVHRQAVLALERQERRLRGSRYKVPRLVESEVLERPQFRAVLAKIAAERGRSLAAVAKEATGCLREMAAQHSPFMMDLFGTFVEFVFSRGYEAPPDFDPDELERLHAITQKSPIAFVFSHRSHFDGLAMYQIIYARGLPPSHIVGGDNMAVFPLGTLGRRSGAVFIRRSFRDDPVYKATIRQYIDYLLEKRFSLSWAIEGTRSRSGKLMPPKLGILSYVVDAWKRARVDDIVFVPVSISYDQIVELADYAAEQKGAKKRAESAAWLFGFVSGIQAPHGRMYVRFGEPLSLAEHFGTREGGDGEVAEDLDLQKLAFDLSVRINRATRLTPTALVSLVLLQNAPRALTLGEVAAEAGDLAAFAAERSLPGAGELGLGDEGGVRATLDSLVGGGVVARHEDGPDAVFAIRESKHLAAAYYRNSVLHFFLAAAVAELALVALAEKNVAVDRAALAAEVAEIRDLLKFEFFFPERVAFEEEVMGEVARSDPAWEENLQSGREAIRAWFDARRPLLAHGTLRPFFESYAIVAEELLRNQPGDAFDGEAFLRACLGLGSQRVLQGRIGSPDAVTRETLKNGLQLARHRGLLAAGEEAAAGRQELLEATRLLRRHTEAIAVIAARRRSDPFG